METNEQLTTIVKQLSKKHCSATIGHILRDVYNVKIKKLTRVFSELNPLKEEFDRLNVKLSYLKQHISENKKDYVSKRAYVSLLTKFNKIKLKMDTISKN